MNITYRQNGDYLIPNIIIRKTKPLGHYGRLRKAYLEMHRPILFNELELAVCEELMKIQIAFFEELGMQKIADHCVRIMEDYRKGIGKRKESDCR